jgi:hypothetical protein
MDAGVIKQLHILAIRTSLLKQLEIWFPHKTPQEQ